MPTKNRFGFFGFRMVWPVPALPSSSRFPAIVTSFSFFGYRNVLYGVICVAFFRFSFRCAVFHILSMYHHQHTAVCRVRYSFTSVVSAYIKDSHTHTRALAYWCRAVKGGRKENKEKRRKRVKHIYMKSRSPKEENIIYLCVHELCGARNAGHDGTRREKKNRWRKNWGTLSQYSKMAWIHYTANGAYSTHETISCAAPRASLDGWSYIIRTLFGQQQQKIGLRTVEVERRRRRRWRQPTKKLRPFDFCPFCSLCTRRNWQWRRPN